MGGKLRLEQTAVGQFDRQPKLFRRGGKRGGGGGGRGLHNSLVDSSGELKVAGWVDGKYRLRVVAFTFFCLATTAVFSPSRWVSVLALPRARDESGPQDIARERAGGIALTNWGVGSGRGRSWGDTSLWRPPRQWLAWRPLSEPSDPPRGPAQGATPSG